MAYFLIPCYRKLKPKKYEAQELAAESHGSEDNVLDVLNKRKEQQHALLEPGAMTLKKALRYFGLYGDFKRLESSLEGVRKHRNTPEQHLMDLKVFDKAVLSKSLECHPDRVKNRGGSDEEMEEAKKQQAALNAIRVFLRVFNKTVLRDIAKDLKYGLYENLSIDSLGREEDVRSRVYDVLFKMSYASEIRREHIIPEIRKFLEAGRNCIKSYKDGNVADFKRNRDSALWYLKMCIVGYESLKTELGKIQRRCGNGIALDCERNISTDLSCLMKLKKVAEGSMSEVKFSSCQILDDFSQVDDYFVLPFVRYINAIILCNAMIDCEKRNKLMQTANECKYYLNSYSMGLDKRFVTEEINKLYYLVSFFSGNKNKEYESMVEKIIRESREQQCKDQKEDIIEAEECKEEMENDISEQQCEGKVEITLAVHKSEGSKCILSKQAIKSAVQECLNNIEEKLNAEFKIENYTESSGTDKLDEDFLECIRKIEEFKKEKEELDKEIEELEEMDAKFEEAKKEAEEFNNELKDLLEKYSSD